MKKLLLYVLLSGFFISANAQGVSKEDFNRALTVSPATLSFKLDRGGSSTQTVTIYNNTKYTYQLALDFIDWTRDSLGRHVYEKVGKSKQSCAAWLKFDRQFIEIDSGKSTTFTVTMNVPDNEEAISEMKWTMLLVKTVTEQMVPTKGAVFETQVNRSLGVGVHIYQTPPNVTNKELKMLSFTQGANDKTYRITCKNTGGTQMYGKFSMELSYAETGAKTVLEPQTAPMFPQQNRVVDFTLPADLPKGKYLAVALIDSGDDDVPIEAAQKEIVIK